MAYDDLKPIDVICEHTADGSIIPLKLRVKDDNGEYQSYRIDSNRDLSGRGSYDTQDGIYVTNETVFFPVQHLGFLGIEEREAVL